MSDFLYQSILYYFKIVLCLIFVTNQFYIILKWFYV